MSTAFEKFKTFLNGLKRPSSEQIEIAELAKKITDFDDGWSWIPNWNEIFLSEMSRWEEYRAKAKSGPLILIATCTGGNSTLTPLESLLAVGLTLRGANVEFLLCDKVLPACPNMITLGKEDQEKFLTQGPDKCDWCFSSGYKAYEQLGLKIHKISDWSKPEDIAIAKELSERVTIESANDFVDENVLIGHHAMTGTLRYFGRGDLNEEENGLAVLKKYVEAGIRTNRALQRLYKQNNYAHTVVNQGIYVPQGVVVGAAKLFDSSVIVFDVGYRKKSIIVDDWTKKFQEGNEHWLNLPWNDEMETEIRDYLNSRRKGTLDWIHVLSADGPDKANEISRQLGIDFNKPTIALLTNVIWDAQVFYPTNAFKTMIEWLRITIEYFKTRTDLQLLIRVHPGELQGFVKSRQLAMDEISKMFPTLPPNVFVIPPESPINTYAVVDQCNAVLIYATTAGIELAGVGYPVIVAGEAWVRDKGFTFDASTPADYKDLLNKLPFASSKIEDDKFVLAQKYAYHHYFRRMITFEMLDPQNSDTIPYVIKPVGINGFLPGADIGLDIVCDGILKNSDFYFPYESRRTMLNAVKDASHEFYTVGTPKH